MARYTKNSNRLNGLNPLAYLGSTDANASAQLVWVNRVPTTQDYDNFYIGCIWIDETALPDPEIWILVEKNADIATWIRLGDTSGCVLGLRADDTNIAYAASNIINVYGSNVVATEAAVMNTVHIGLTNGAAGQVIIGGGIAPVWGSITSTSGTVAVVVGANTINLEVGPTVATTYTADAGTATPALNNLNVLGGNVVTTVGAGSTVTVSLTNGTAGQVIIGGGAAPVWGTIASAGGTVVVTLGANTINLEVGPTVATNYVADFGNAIPALNLLNVVGANVVTTTGLANILTVGLTNGGAGQVIIGGGAAPTWGTITSTGGTITITLGANTINLEAGPTIATTYTADVGTATPALNNLNVLGGDNINTAAAGSTVTVHLNETIHWPDTNAAGTTGMIYLGGAGGAGGTRFLHNYGTQNTFYGSGTGNLTLATGAGHGDLTAIGYVSGQSITDAREDTLVGAYTGRLITTGSYDTSIGCQSLYSLTTGAGNTAVGVNALRNLVSGDFNCTIGCGYISTVGAGIAYTTNESNNVCIQNNGVVGENNTIRIGTHGASSYQQNRCFIAGIRGITTGVADAIAVLIDSAHQLGTVSSSRKYKDNIKDMADESSIIYSLRPVTFNFKEHPTVPAWGLIAEEVVDVFPQLVVFDPETGDPESVKYHELPVLLLHELQKQHKKVEKQQEQIKNLKDRVRILEEQVAMILTTME